FEEPDPNVIDHAPLLRLSFQPQPLDLLRLDRAALPEFSGGDDFLADEYAVAPKAARGRRIGPQIAKLRVGVQAHLSQLAARHVNRRGGLGEGGVVSDGQRFQETEGQRLVFGDGRGGRVGTRGVPGVRTACAGVYNDCIGYNGFAGAELFVSEASDSQRSTECYGPRRRRDTRPSTCCWTCGRAWLARAKSRSWMCQY